MNFFIWQLKYMFKKEKVLEEGHAAWLENAAFGSLCLANESFSARCGVPP